MSRFVYLIRHGQTPVNARAVLHQTADDASLTELGQQQIRATATWLQSQKPRLKNLYCSTEYRAKQSAEVLAENLGKLPVVPQANLQERQWGDWSGKVWSEVEEVLQDFSLEDRYTFVPPRGESWQQFVHRLQAVWWQLVESTNPDEDLVIVTHGGVMRALLPELLQLPLETSFMIQPTNGEVMTFELVARSSTAATPANSDNSRAQILERTDLNFVPPVQN